MRSLRLIAFVLLSFGICHSANAAPLSGTRSVGPTGDYASLTTALVDVNAGDNGLGGALVLELQASYVSTVETFPLTIPTLTGASATNTLTICPASGATGLSISSADTTAATVDLNGAQYVTFDGRPGGTGTAKELTIENTSTSGVAMRFVNEASNNTLKHITLRGMNTSATSGTVVFSTTTGANGNDNNLIDTCDIRDGATTPAVGIYALGTTTTAAQNNSGNTVSNCNVINFLAATGVDAAGVRLDAGNDAWIVTSNSFYQTTTQTAVAAAVRAIYINNPSGYNFTVTSNFIGGSAPNARGTPWTTTGTTAALTFTGIHLQIGTNTPSSIQGNTVANIVWTSSSNANATVSRTGVLSGIYLRSGAANIGTVTGNTIGSGIGTGSISVTTSGSGGTCFGISSISSGGATISNNTIGSIIVNGTSTSVAASLVGISLASSTVTDNVVTVSNNLVGSTITANSLNAATSSASSFPSQDVMGILVGSNTTSVTIRGNTVANLNNSSVQTTSLNGQTHGIKTSQGVRSIIGNTVRNLSTTSQNESNGEYSSMCGISVQFSQDAAHIVSQNTVHSLANTAASAEVSVTGIYFSGKATSTNEISRNFVHSLAVSSSSMWSQLNGIHFGDGNFTAQNNIVRIGLNADGISTASASILYGIRDGTITSADRNFYHNSVYVGGTAASGKMGTYAFYGGGGSGGFNSRTYQNNIFVNARSNIGGPRKHYAVNYSGKTINPRGLTAGGNIFLANGIGGVLGSYNDIDHATLAAWQAATGQDYNSAVADPRFVNPAGDANTVDLHLQTSNPAENGGIQLTNAVTGVPVTVTDDFDGQPRSTLTPTDVGADAGNFTLTPGDIFAPFIRYPLLTNSSTSNRVLTGWATIKDNSGSIAGGANTPRLYYKKSTDADVFGGNTASDNGWKYVTATGSSPYSFTLDYSLIYGGSVSVGESVQYFVVAQDAANNLGSSPAAATASATPPVQNMNGHGAVNSYSIVGTISGTKSVGAGGDYPSLSGVGGLFAALNASVLTGSLVVNITSDLMENGSVTLSQLNSNDFPQPSVVIQPDSTTMRTITGTASAGLITFNGADYVTIDGSSGGGGRFLTFRNTNTGNTASTILLQNDSSYNTVRSCVVEGAGIGGFAVIGFGSGAVTGNDNNLISANQVRDRSDSAGVPLRLIFASGSSTATNSGNIISDNEMFNFNRTGILIGSQGDENWTISGNNIYQVNPGNESLGGIQFNGLGTNLISGNYIHDLFTTGTLSVGISFSSASTANIPGIRNTTISGNRITAFNVDAATRDVYGILAQGGVGSKLNILNSQITLIPALNNRSLVVGIYDVSSSDSEINLFHNSILIGGTEIGTRNSWASRRVNSNTHTSRNNIFLNLRTGGSGSHFASGSENFGGSYTVSHNVYAGTGATAENFMDFSFTSGTPAPVSFAAWQSSTGDTSTSASNPGGNYSAAMFMNAATGDLHLIPGGNVLVNNAGTPIAGVTMDYDGDPRSVASPTVGADEFINQNPTFSGYSVSTKKNTAISIGKAKLLARAADIDGGTLSISAVSATSTQGGSVTLGAGSVSYTPPLNFTGLDTFTLTIIDGQGGSVVGTVTVNVTSGTAVGGNQASQITLQPGGAVSVLFFGIPGQSYQIQRSPDLTNWTFLQNVTAAADGTISFTDPNPPPGAGFYRTVVP
jgi:trimeric autotransporter adhesin